MIGALDIEALFLSISAANALSRVASSFLELASYRRVRIGDVRVPRQDLSDRLA